MRKFLPEKIRRPREAVAYLVADLEENAGLTVAGSWRRNTPTVGDLDILVPVTHDYDAIIAEAKERLGYVEMRGGMTSQGVIPNFDDDGDLLLNFWKVPSAEAWGAMLLFATGPVDLNVMMRSRAMQKGLMLSQYGLMRDAVQIDDSTEADIFQRLGLGYLGPEWRQQWRYTLDEVSKSRTVLVPSSDGKTSYNVTLNSRGLATACPCRGFTFRGHCRHLAAAERKEQ
jgi:DNA polymerase (family 10)